MEDGRAGVLEGPSAHRSGPLDRPSSSLIFLRQLRPSFFVHPPSPGDLAIPVGTEANHLTGTSYRMNPSRSPSLTPWQLAHFFATAGTTVAAKKVRFSPVPVTSS